MRSPARCAQAALAVLILLALPAAGPGSKGPGDAARAPWARATSPRSWSFPEDHFAHPGFRTEWWYLVGHLEDAETGGPILAFQVTWFRAGLAPEGSGLASAWAGPDLAMAHLAWTELQRGEHHFREVLWRSPPFLSRFGRSPGPDIVTVRAPSGGAGRWRLALDDEGGLRAQVQDGGAGFSLDLRLRAGKPPVLHGPGGLSRKSRSGERASYYYSLTRLGVDGAIVIGGEVRSVAGRAWFDHEFGSQGLEPGAGGWDWMGLQLDDGRDLMVFRVRGGEPFIHGTLVSPEGVPRDLEGDDLQMAPTGFWTSPVTGGRYPVSWRVTIPGESLSLVVSAQVEDQENVVRLVPGLTYWEGSVRASSPDGKPLGSGFLELTGYVREAAGGRIQR